MYIYIIVQVHDMVGTVVATPNMAHNTEEVNSSSMGGNPPQLSVNDSYQLPLLSPNTSAPLLDPDAESNCYIPSMVTARSIHLLVWHVIIIYNTLPSLICILLVRLPSIKI